KRDCEKAMVYLKLLNEAVEGEETKDAMIPEAALPINTITMPRVFYRCQLCKHDNGGTQPEKCKKCGCEDFHVIASFAAEERGAGE
ncbi:unnamed protein product, partial [marine sediment metagenome]